MAKSVSKKQLFKGNAFNYIFLIIASLMETVLMMVTSIMLEKVIAVATANDLDGLYKQGTIFLILLVTMIAFFVCLLKIQPTFKKRALNQYKSNAYDGSLSLWTNDKLPCLFIFYSIYTKSTL